MAPSSVDARDLKRESEDQKSIGKPIKQEKLRKKKRKTKSDKLRSIGLQV